MLLLHVIARYQSTMMYETSFWGLALTNCAYTKDSMNGRQDAKMRCTIQKQERIWLEEPSHTQTNPLRGRRWLAMIFQELLCGGWIFGSILPTASHRFPYTAQKLDQELLWGCRSLSRCQDVQETQTYLLWKEQKIKDGSTEQSYRHTVTYCIC